MTPIDRAADHLGIAVTEDGATRVATSLTVAPNHLNALGVCHGGVLFTLADAAMAAISNHGAAGWAAFAVNAEIDFLRPATEGMVLTATAEVTARAGRTGVHDVAIHDSDGTLIAVFRGRTRTVTTPQGEIAAG